MKAVMEDRVFQVFFILACVLIVLYTSTSTQPVMAFIEVTIAGALGLVVVWATARRKSD